MKRVILIVLDSVGIGELPDAALYKDEGTNTVLHIFEKRGLNVPNMLKLGLGNIEGLEKLGKEANPVGAYGRMKEKSKGKDTTTGHWEMSGVILDKAFPTYPNGFSDEIIEEFKQKAGLDGILANTVASGTEIIKEYGEEHIKTGYPIIYTSADSVFQVAAHEEYFGLERLYKVCEVAREMLVGENAVGRVIARPFIGEVGDFQRTRNRKDYALDPFGKTMLNAIKENGKNVLAVGKIEDIFNGNGITSAVHTVSNMDGVDKTLEYMDIKEDGLIFTNLVDFDMMYGHRNDAEGYGKALEDFDARIPEIIEKMEEEDVLIITADHGCDPTTKGTDHTREYVPVLIYGPKIESGKNIGTRESFSDLSETILDILEVPNLGVGESFEKNI